MKVSSKTFIIPFITAIFVAFLSFFVVSAQNVPLTNHKIEQIRGECLSTKNTLSQLHASDALLRVNRGQIYESMYTKLMDRFNSRVANNKLNNSDLERVTNDYTTALDTFRDDYKTYEEQLAKAISIDCSKQPTNFYDAVILARSKRAIVNDDIIKLNQYIDQYQLVIEQFEYIFLSTQEGE